jgi:hypothetical protein
MKQNTLVKILAAGAACALAISSAMAQGAGVSANVGPVGVSAGVGLPGTFTSYTPGQDYFMFRGASGDPGRYYYTPETTVVDESGSTLAWSDIRADVPATVYYEKVGDRMVVKKVIVTRKTKANTGTAVSKTTETTTTTTVKP